jgi:hypothetical protein
VIDWKAKIKHLRSLKDDWDGKEARKPTEGAICVAERFLKEIAANEVSKIASVEPGTTGGVDIVIRGPLDHVKVTLEIEHDGEATAVFVDGDIDVKRIKPGPKGHKRFIKEMAQFLRDGELH